MRNQGMWKWALVLTVMSVATLLARAEAQAQEDGRPIELSYIIEDANYATVLHPRQMLLSPYCELAATEVVRAGIYEDLHFDPLEVSEILIQSEGVEQIDANITLSYVITIYRFVEPQDIDDLVSDWRAEVESDEHEGRPIRWSEEGLSLYMPDDTTLVSARRETLERMVAGEAGNNARLVEALASFSGEDDVYGVIDVKAEYGRMQAAEESETAVYPESFNDILGLGDILRVQLNLYTDRESRIEIVAANEEGAKKIQEHLQSYLDTYSTFFPAVELPEDEAVIREGTKQATFAYYLRMFKVFLHKIELQQEGARVWVADDIYAGNVGDYLRLMVLAEICPEAYPRFDRRKQSESLTNLNGCLMGLQLYSQEEGQLPPLAITSEAGEPLLSWRVAILPYVGYEDLYEEFHLDEAWDSEHNRQLIERMPHLYRGPKIYPGREFCTSYLAIVSAGGYSQAEDATELPAFSELSQDTALLVESNDLVIWTKPADWQYETERPWRGLGGNWSQGEFLLGYAGGFGLVHTVDVTPEELCELFESSAQEELLDALPEETTEADD